MQKPRRSGLELLPYRGLARWYCGHYNIFGASAAGLKPQELPEGKGPMFEGSPHATETSQRVAAGGPEKTPEASQ